jgi:hypothetical protein
MSREKYFELLGAIKKNSASWRDDRNQTAGSRAEAQWRREDQNTPPKKLSVSASPRDKNTKFKIIPINPFNQST